VIPVIERFDAGIAGAAAALLAAAAFLLHAARGRTPRPLLVLRGAAAAALIMAVLRPTFALVESRLAKPNLLILLDSGASMRGRGEGGTRWSAAAAWLARHEPEVSARANVTVALVSDRVRPLRGVADLAAESPEGVGFSPAQALAGGSAATAVPASRVWLISDGLADGAADAGAFSRLGAPVDVLGVGPSRREKGCAFGEIKTPDFAFLHEEFPVTAAVELTGLGGRDVELTLAREDNGVPGGWRETGRLKRRASADYEIIPASFSATAQSLGTQRWRLRAVSGGAATVRQFRVEVVRQKYRIMYLSGRPSAEYSFLREFLKSDPNRELVSFVILRNPENIAPAQDRDLSLIPFPAEDIFVRTLPQFDLFILENFSAAKFHLPPAYLESLKRFVAGGGALLVKGGENAFSAGGYRGSPLEEVLPVSLSARAPDFETGLFYPKPLSFEHPLLKLFDTPDESRRAWAALPPLDGWGRFASLRQGALAAATHPTALADDGTPLPVIAVRPYGRGKVMLVSTDSTWRWKLGAAQDASAAGVYERFWTRAIQYLTGSLDLSKVKFSPLPDRIVAREPFSATVRVFQSDFSPAASGQTRVRVLWTPPGGRPREAAVRETAPGAYTVELTGLSPGAHQLRASARVDGRAWGEDAVSFLWQPDADNPMDKAWLSQAASLGGGEFRELSATTAGELLSRLPPATPKPSAVRRAQPFSSSLWLALTAALFLIEWSWRRRRGHA
jgi:uncharacterized membrane protein